MSDHVLMVLGGGMFVLLAIIIFLPCLSGSLLEQQFGSIADAAYNAEWYTMPIKYRIFTKIIIQRSQKRFQLTGARLLICSLEKYTDVSTRWRCEYQFIRLK